MKRVHNDYGTTAPATEGSPPASVTRQQPAKGRKRKTDAAPAAQPSGAARKAAIKNSPVAEPAEVAEVPARPLLEQWMDHRHAVEELIRGLDKPEDSRNIQQIAEVQQRLATMAQMTTDLSVVKTESYNTTG